MNFDSYKKRLQRAGLIALSLTTVLMGWFSLGFEVSVGDWTSGQPLSAAQISRCFDAARAAALELGYPPKNVETRVIPRLVLGKSASPDADELARELLISRWGARTLWGVYAGERFVGYAEAPSELFEMMDDYLYTQGGSEAVTASYNADVRICPRYVPEGTEADSIAAVAAIKEYGVKIITA